LPVNGENEKQQKPPPENFLSASPRPPTGWRFLRGFPVAKMFLQGWLLDKLQISFPSPRMSVSAVKFHCQLPLAPSVSALNLSA